MKALQMSVNEQQESTMVIEKSELQESVADVIADNAIHCSRFRIASGQHHVLGWNLFLLEEKIPPSIRKVGTATVWFQQKGSCSHSQP
jgi:hypothetical protein